MGNSSLWVSVLRSKFGNFVETVEKCRKGRRRGKDWSSWWRDVVMVVACKDWFWGELKKSVGIGKGTKFWEDLWVCDGVRLFS